MAVPEQRSEDIYEALPTSRSLRLLNLARLPEDHAYGLETFEIGQCPPYSTMSYTWGPPLNTKQCEEDYTRDSHRVITLLTSRGKGHLSIGRNLYEGLQKGLPEVQYLWVDAICINQNDTAERSIQVPLMGSIYADANSVLVWLGLDESNVADFKWIHEIFYAALLAFAGKDDIQNFAWTPGVDSPLADRTLQVHATPRWQGYADFVAERRWFRVSTGIYILTLCLLMVLQNIACLDFSGDFSLPENTCPRGKFEHLLGRDDRN
jgi:hypothetical protein